MFDTIQQLLIIAISVTIGMSIAFLMCYLSDKNDKT